MASAAEQLASNLNWGSIGKATELKKRLWFTIGALLVFRVGAYIPVPGVDPAALAEIFQQNAGGIAGMLDVFSGGSIGRMSILALVDHAVHLGLHHHADPDDGRAVARGAEEGGRGRPQEDQPVHPLRHGDPGAFQAYGIAVGLESQTASIGPVVHDPGLFFRFVTIVTLVGGTLLLMWLGEQITARGVGNGTSLIIFAGIVAALPSAMVQTLELGRTGALSALFIIALAVGVIVGRGGRGLRRDGAATNRGAVSQAPGRQPHVWRRGLAPAAQDQHLGRDPADLRLLAAALPATIASFQGTGGEAGVMQWIATYLAHGQPLYLLTYIGLIVFFCFFYTTVVFNPVDTGDNLKKNGGFVPGIRPGKNTAEYLEYILNRLTVIGALYLSAVCILPELLIARGGVPFYFGGTSLLIVVSVTLDTVTQIQAHLLAHQYEGLIKKAASGQGR
jgi:preprotein translocase subunit SecY